jgi:hypothetical protein
MMMTATMMSMIEVVESRMLLQILNMYRDNLWSLIFYCCYGGLLGYRLS